MSRYIEIGDAVFDKHDQLVHRVVETSGERCVTACQQTAYRPWGRVATNYLDENPHGPRWRVFVPVNCMTCIACET